MSRFSNETTHIISLTHYGLVKSYNDMKLSIGSVNGLMPDDTKLLPELRLIYH